MKPDFATLDAIVVGGVLVIIGAGVAGLMFLHIPQENLAILASLLSGLVGTVIGGYAGYRWGASQTDKGHPVAGTASVSIQATTGDLKPDEAAAGQTT